MAYYGQSSMAVAQPYYQQTTAYYQSQPSYPSSSHSSSSHPKSRGHRVCDTCGNIENPQMGRFRYCGGCMVTQYCSPECQRSNWPSHKALCRHTSEQIAATKKHASAAGLSADFPDQDLAKNLRKFASAHIDILGWAGFQALQLKRMPSNIRHYALQINLNYRNSSDSSRRFSIASVELVSRSLLNNAESVNVNEVLRREDRCRKQGGIGVAVIFLQCGMVSQVLPVEVDSPSKIIWDVREDWEQMLRMYTDAGRTDFKAPISRR